MLEARDRVHYENDSKMREVHDELMATVAYWMLSDRFLSKRKYLFLLAILATVGIGCNGPQNLDTKKAFA